MTGSLPSDIVWHVLGLVPQKSYGKDSPGPANDRSLLQPPSYQMEGVDGLFPFSQDPTLDGRTNTGHCCLGFTDYPSKQSTMNFFGGSTME